MFSSYSNQSIDFKGKSMDCFLYYGKLIIDEIVKCMIMYGLFLVLVKWQSIIHSFVLQYQPCIFSYDKYDTYWDSSYRKSYI